MKVPEGRGEAESKILPPNCRNVENAQPKQGWPPSGGSRGRLYDFEENSLQFSERCVTMGDNSERAKIDFQSDLRRSQGRTGNKPEVSALQSVPGEMGLKRP